MSVLQSVLNNLASWPLLLPELLVATTIVVILVLTFLIPQYQHYWLFPVAFLGTFLALCNKYWLRSQLSLSGTLFLCNQLLVLDPIAIFFCLLLLITILFLLFLSIPRAPLPLNKAYQTTHVILLLGNLLGSCLLVMAFHWLTIYLGLTLLSLTSALLIGSQATPQSAEASLKYLLYSMATNAVMLWGMAHFYGFMGTLSLSYTAWEPSVQHLPEYIVLAILLLCVSSILFVLAAAPYHFWVPDVYQGTPATVMAYLSTAPKLTTVAFLLRFFHQFLPQLGPILLKYTQQGMAVLALLTIIVGNTAALVQNNVHRLLAYGSIAQGGLLIAGIAASTSSQLGVLYYSAAYGATYLAAWIGIKLLQQHLKEDICLQNCVGLGRRFPMLGSGITLVMLALVGLPPTAGFVGKFMIFTAIWERIQYSGDFLFAVLLIAGFLSTLLSVYYYLNFSYRLFCQPTQLPTTTTHVNNAEKIILWCLIALILAGFFMANSLLKGINSWIGGGITRVFGAH